MKNLAVADLVCVAVLMLICFGARAESVSEQELSLQRFDHVIAVYREIGLRGGWPVISDGSRLEPGTSDRRVVALRRRLLASGDLNVSNENADYDAELESAVRHFQRRHGLAPDGKVGRETLGALNVPVPTRIAQLEINKQRWQMFPELGPSHVLINTAAAVLDVVQDESVIIRMKTIVGDRRHPTPVFHSRITAVVFYPYWTVPKSIATREMLPRLRREPGYLAAQNIEIVGRPQDPFGLQVNWHAVSARNFPFQFRQNPGPQNSLGLIKFDIPNEYDVYLHDTPTKALFQRPVRTFSHGCIRVSQPRELAVRILADQGWDTDAVDFSIASQTTRRVSIERPVPVHVVYLTAFIDPDGTTQFREDIYGRDRAALAGWSAERSGMGNSGDIASQAAASDVGCGS